MRSLAALLCLLAGIASAGTPLRLCRRQCDQAAVDCIQSTGQRFRPCKRQLVRLCHRQGLAVCLPPVTTTTTTATTAPTLTTLVTTTAPGISGPSTTYPIIPGIFEIQVLYAAFFPGVAVSPYCRNYGVFLVDIRTMNLPRPIPAWAMAPRYWSIDTMPGSCISYANSDPPADVVRGWRDTVLGVYTTDLNALRPCSDGSIALGYSPEDHVVCTVYTSAISDMPSLTAVIYGPSCGRVIYTGVVPVSSGPSRCVGCLYCGGP